MNLCLRLNKKYKNGFVPELQVFWKEHWNYLIGSSGGNPEIDVLALRNHLAHAGRLPDSQAENLLNLHQKKFEEVISLLHFFENYSVVTGNKGNETLFSIKGLPINWQSNIKADMLPANLSNVYLVNGDQSLNLFPFIVLMM